jgi:hypothetical protein
MNSLEAIPVLNRLLQVLCRSLPAYLADAKPWGTAGNQSVQAALDHLVADQQRYARRVADAITAQGGRPDPGRFPMEYMAKNDLSLDFLLQEVINSQQRDVTALEHCAAQFEDVSSLHALAEEILGNARGHLDILKGTIRAEG